MENNNQQNFSPQQPPINPIPPTPAKKLSNKIIAIIILAVVAGIVSWLALNRQPKVEPVVINHQPKTNLSNNESQTSPQPLPANLPTGNIVIYSKEVSEQVTSSRGWPTVSIFRKVNDQAPELLATVGKVGEYPIDFVITPDKKYLLINLESKLQILDLANKELKDLIIAKEQIEALAFSPDKTQLFIWDQKYAGASQYYARIYDFKTQKEKTVGEGQYNGSFIRGNWRDDNKVILALAQGEYSGAWYYDLSSNKLFPTPEKLEYGFLSDNAKMMAVTNSSVNNICNEMSGSAVSTYRIVEPITGQEYAKVGDSTKASYILAFSPDNKQILYSAESTAKTREDCDKKQPVSYFIFDITTKSFKPTSDYQNVLGEWKQVNNWIIEYEASGYPKVKNVKLNGKILASFNGEAVQVITVYQAN